MKKILLILLVTCGLYAQAQGINTTGITIGKLGLNVPSTVLGEVGLDRPGGVSYDADASALFARMTTPPTDARKTLINQLILDLKSNGLWTKFVAFWMMAAETSQAGTLNWISTSYNLTLMSSPTFTTDRGFQTNGSTNYIKTGVIPLSVGTFLQDDGAFGLYVNVNADQNAVDMGATGGTHYCLLYTNLGSALYSSMNDGGSTPSSSVTDAIGLSILCRQLSASYRVNKNGVNLGSKVVVSTGLTSVELYIGARNSSGTADRFASKRYAFGFVSSGLTDPQMATIYTLILAHLTAIGGN